MALLQSIVFTTPWALAGLILLPVIWWLLRFTPPKPQAIRFPPLRLLLELVSREEQPDRTPWWLMALRLALATLLILAVAHPLYSPGAGRAGIGGPLLLIVDDSWAAARDWELRKSLILEHLSAAQRAQQTVVLATTVAQSRPDDLVAVNVDLARQKAAALAPKALDPDRLGLLKRLAAAFGGASSLHVVWMSDGLDYGSSGAFADGLLKLAKGSADIEAIVPEVSRIPPALARPAIDSGKIKVTVLRPKMPVAGEAAIEIRAANGRSLADAKANFAAGSGKAEVSIDLPVELRNDAQRVEIKNGGSASGVYLFDDRWRRKTVGLVSGSSLEFAQPLLSPLYYVSRALEPYAELYEPADAHQLADRLSSGLSLLVLADVGVVPAESHDAIEQWVNGGGVLLRFAGPRLAGGQDNLIPVQLRQGDRSLGSALSWEEPQPLQPFAEQSPFAGLSLDPEIRVSRQVLAEPDPDLGSKVWASLADGTPLVTAAKHGNGLIVLVHVTANAEWSNLPLSGLFVDMLRRIVDLAPGAGSAGASAATASSENPAAFVPRRTLTGTGDLSDPPTDARPVPATEMDRAAPSPEHPAGLYVRAASERAINLVHQGDALATIHSLPSRIAVRGLKPADVIDLSRLLFVAAFGLFLLDCLAVIFLAGGWSRLRTRGTVATLIAVALAMSPAGNLRAQNASTSGDAFALENTLQTRFAYVLTGDGSVDDTSLSGLRGLGSTLLQRTSVEPGEPVGINLEKDEIVFFPLLYWPVLPSAEAPSPAALAKLDLYMKNGGTILFDTRDDGSSFSTMTGAPTPTLLALRRILEKLDIPALEPVPPDHVLTKAFYLLQSFPGRYDTGDLWVERTDTQNGSSGNADGVTSIMIGSNDYAAAWAMDNSGHPLYATVPGGDRQRELAFRAGINIVMYALTGNYKADQVHVPALLERLGQ